MERKDLKVRNPELRDIIQDIYDEVIGAVSILAGDVAISVDPETVGSSAAAVTTAIAGDGFSRDVDVSIVDSDGNILPFNGSLPVAVAVVTVGDGTAAIEGSLTSLTFVDGEASVQINYTGTWAAADTCTLTVGSSSSIAGTSVADATSVDTLVA